MAGIQRVVFDARIAHEGRQHHSARTQGMGMDGARFL